MIRVVLLLILLVFKPTIDEYTHLLFFSFLTCVRSVLDELLRCRHRLGSIRLRCLVCNVEEVVGVV